MATVLDSAVIKLVSQIIKNFYNPMHIPVEKWAKEMNELFYFWVTSGLESNLYPKSSRGQSLY